MRHWLEGASALGARMKSLQSWASDLWGGGVSRLVLVSLKRYNDASLGSRGKICNLKTSYCCCSLTQSSFLQPHGLLHARLPCPSPSPRAWLNSCPLSWWCHPIISSSVVPFSSCLQSFPASGSFLMSRFFESGGQSIGASASVLPMNMDCSQVLLLKPSADMRVMTSC